MTDLYHGPYPVDMTVNEAREEVRRLLQTATPYVPSSIDADKLLPSPFDDRAEGAAQERAEIVAWLRENAPQYSHEQLADAIERGEYKRSE